MPRFSNPLNITTLGPFLERVRASNYCVVDLTEFGFIDVYASVVLALLLRNICMTQDPPDLILPRSHDVLAYLARQDFFRTLNPWYEMPEEIRVLESRQRGENPAVAPLTIVECEDAVTGITDRIFALLQSPAFGVAAPVAKAAWTVLSETLQNIPQHASVGLDRREPGFAALQLYRDRLEVAVGDVGAGLGTTLRRNRRYRNCDDARAQVVILEHGATGTNEAGRGNGLQVTAQTVSGLRGSLRLQSGNAVTLWWKGGWTQRMCPVFPGTQLLIHIPVRRR